MGMQQPGQYGIGGRRLVSGHRAQGPRSQYLMAASCQQQLEHRRLRGLGLGPRAVAPLVACQCPLRIDRVTQGPGQIGERGLDRVRQPTWRDHRRIDPVGRAHGFAARLAAAAVFAMRCLGAVARAARSSSSSWVTV